MIATTFSKPALFVAVLLPTIWAVHSLRRRGGEAVQYYAVIGITGLLALVVFRTPADFWDDFPMLGLVLVFEVIILVFASLWLSLTTLINPSPVPWWFALPCLLAALLFVLFLLLVSIGVGSSGMIGQVGNEFSETVVFLNPIE